jgi:hypothetical protein
MELLIPFYGIHIVSLLRYSVRSADLRQLLSASIAVYRPQEQSSGGKFDGKVGVPC